MLVRGNTFSTPEHFHILFFLSYIFAWIEKVNRLETHRDYTLDSIAFISFPIFVSRITTVSRSSQIVVSFSTRISVSTSCNPCAISGSFKCADLSSSCIILTGPPTLGAEFCRSRGGAPLCCINGILYVGRASSLRGGGDWDCRRTCCRCWCPCTCSFCSSLWLRSRSSLLLLACCLT